MTNWTVLNNAIRQVIYSNGTRDITGQILQTALLNIVNSVGSLPTFGGTATPSTNPGVHDGPVFYIATAEGTYSNFNNIAITKSEVPSVLVCINNTWSKQVIGTSVAADISALETSLSSETSRAQAKEAELQEAIADQNDEIADFKEAITDQVNNYQPVVIEGDVTNAADEEDITSENGLLKIKNRSALNGMGYVILRRGSSFASQVTLPNTIYEVRYDFDLNGAEVTIPANCILQFDGGKLSNGKLIGENSLINSGISLIFSDVEIGGTWKNNRIFSAWWSNKDNILCKSLTSLMTGNSCYVEFEKGVTYEYAYEGNTGIGGYTAPLLKAEGCKNVEINFNGSIQRVKTNNSNRYDLLQIIDCDFAHIHDGELVGDRLNHDYNSISGSHEWGYGIYVAGKNAKIERINAHDFTGDAINVSSLYNYTLQSYVSEVNTCDIVDCNLHHSRRQGLTYGGSIETSQLKLYRCHIHHIGSFDDIQGTAPNSGIDSEPENPEKTNGTLIIENSSIDNCSTSAIVCSQTGCTTQGIIIINSTIVGSVANGSSINNRIYNSKIKTQESNVKTFLNVELAENCNFELNKDAIAIYLMGLFCNCIFDDKSEDSTIVGEYSGCMIRTGVNKYPTFKDCKFKHIVGRVPNPLTYQYSYANTGFGETVDNGKYEFIRCTIEDCSAQFNNYDVVFNECNIIRGAYLKLHKASIVGCYLEDVLQMGTIYHEGPQSTILKYCRVKQTFGSTLSYSHSLTLGNNSNKLKLVGCIVNITEVLEEGQSSSMQSSMLNMIIDLCHTSLDIPESVSFSNIISHNSVIYGNRNTSDATAENTTYISNS